MLTSLDIRNLAVVEEVGLEFGPGLNVVTGETGAGKSLILGAIQLLLGERGGPHLIRPGADRCELTAEIRLPEGETAGRVQTLLDQAGAPPCEDRRLLLRRIITRTGSRAFANAAPVTMLTLRKLGEGLIDLHGPHEHQSLLHPAVQRELLDRFAGAETEREQVRKGWEHIRKLETEIESLARNHPPPETLARLRREVQEIEAAQLTPEDDTLFERFRAAAGGRELLRILSACRAGLDESEDSVADRIAAILRELEAARDIDPEGAAPFIERLEALSETVRDLAYDLAGYQDAVDVDPAEIARMEERLALLHRLKRKYGETTAEILETAEHARTELDRFAGREDRLETLRRQLATARQEHETACRRLRQLRETAAATLAQQVSEKLHRLAFAHAAFQVALTPTQPGPDGADTVEFLFAGGPEIQPMPLRKIASSGETARVMLAVKTVLSTADRVPILLFDEIDANIGGRAAVIVAAELQAVARRRQVLCITHLPQIAAAGNRHFRVSKRIENGQSLARVVPLTPDQRLAEIIRMLGAPENSPTALAHARELLKNAAGPA